MIFHKNDTLYILIVFESDRISPRESAKTGRMGAHGLNCKIFLNIFEIFVLWPGGSLNILKFIFQLLLLHGAELIDFEGKNELTEFMSDRIKEIIETRPICKFEENLKTISETRFKFNFTTKMNFVPSDLLERRLKASFKNRFNIDVEDFLDGENNVIRYGPLEIFGSKINNWMNCVLSKFTALKAK